MAGLLQLIGYDVTQVLRHFGLLAHCAVTAQFVPWAGTFIKIVCSVLAR